MPKTLLPAGEQFDLPEEWEENFDDEPVIELRSGYRVRYSLRPVGLSSHEPSGAEATFRELADEWREATRLSSSLTEMFLNRAYQRIIGMGPTAVPLILRELQQRPAHWFWALSSITGEDPVNPEDAGRLRVMTAAWLRWGQERGYL